MKSLLNVMIIFFPFAKVWILLDVIYISTFLSFAPTQKKKKKKLPVGSMEYTINFFSIRRNNSKI